MREDPFLSVGGVNWSLCRDISYESIDHSRACLVVPYVHCKFLVFLAFPLISMKLILKLQFAKPLKSIFIESTGHVLLLVAPLLINFRNLHRFVL